MIARKFKRCLAGFVAAATVLSSSNITYAAEHNLLTADNGSWSTTAAEIVAGEYYGDNANVAGILNHEDIVKGTPYAGISVPTDETTLENDMKLVVIDTESRVVYANEYETNHGIWVPVSAVIDPADDTIEPQTVAFSKDTSAEAENDYVSGTYADTIVSCTASVTYEFRMSFDEAEQAEQVRLSEIPEILAEGLGYLDTVGSVALTISNINTAIEAYEDQLAEEYKKLTGKEKDFSDAIPGVDVEGKLDSYVLAIDDADDAGTRFAYLINNAAGISAAAADVLNDLEKIETNEYVVEELEDLSEYLEDLKADLATLQNGAEAADAVKAVFHTADQYGDEDLEKAAEAAVYNPLTNVKAEVVAATTTVTATADMVKVTIRVEAEVAADDVFEDLDAVTTKALPAYEDVFYYSKMEEGHPALSFVKGDICGKAQNDVSNAAFALDGWKDYELTDHALYEMVEPDLAALEALTELTADLIYTIKYEVAEYGVSTNYDGTQMIPYGTKIMLPIHSDETMDYDYVAKASEDGPSTYYNEGAILTITENLNIEQSEAAMKGAESLLSVLSKDTQYEGLTVVKDILTSAAVKSPTVTIRQPENTAISDIETDGEGSYRASAGNVPSGVAGMIWTPVSARVMNGETALDVDVAAFSALTAAEDVTEIQFIWETAEEFTHLEVQYVLEITSVNVDNKYVALTDEDMLGYLNLSAELVKEVKAQNNILQNKVFKVYDAIQSDDNLQTVMNVSVLQALQGKLTGNGQAAIQYILDNCAKGSELAIYYYLKECNNVSWSLSSYYANGYYEAIRTQAELLAPQLRIIAADANLGTAMADYGIDGDVESIRSQIYEFTAKLDGKDKDGNPALENGVAVEGLTSTIQGPNAAFVDLKELEGEEATSALVAFSEVIADILAIDDEVQIPVFTESKGLKTYTALTKDAPKYGSYTVIVKDPKGNESSFKIIFEKENEADVTRVVTADDVTAINDKVVELSALLGISGNDVKYYEADDSQIPAVGAEVSVSSTIIYTYSPRSYTLTVSGSDAESVTFTGTTTAVIPLESFTTDTESEYYYVYTITEVVNGETVVTQSVVANNTTTPYSVKNMSDLADGKDTLKIERAKMNADTEEIDAFVDTLNDALKADAALRDADGNLLAAFVPVKNFASGAVNGEYESIVLRLDNSSVNSAQNLMTAIGNAMVNIALSTPYIGFGELDSEGNSQLKFLYSVENTGTQVDIQAMVDLLLTSGLSLDVFTEIIDENGSVINNVTVGEGSNAVKEGLLADATGLGGVIVDSSIQIGTSEKAGNFHNIPLYMTLAGNQSEYLKGIRAFADAISGYASIEFANGMISANAVLPESAYTVYLSVMLMLGELSLDNINDQELKDHINILKDLLLSDLALEDVTYKTVENTINTYLSADYDFEPYKDIIGRIINTLKSVQNKDISAVTTETKNQIFAELTYDVGALLGENVADFASLLTGTTVTLPMNFTVENLVDEVEAIVLDLGQEILPEINDASDVEKLVQKLSYVSDVEEALANAKGVTYVVLLKDIEQKKAAEDENARVLNIVQPTILNLNGQSVMCNINAGSAALRIVDSTLDAEAVGSVFGTITAAGDNVRIAAGNYTNDVTAMLQNGYEQVDGVVTSKYYKTAVDEEGNLIVELSSQFADITEGNMQTLVLDMVSDLFFEFYTTASVTVDDKMIISADASDILSDVVAKDYKALAEALKGCINTENASWLANDLYNKFGDLNKVADIIENGGVIASYKVKTANWGVKAELVGEGDENRIGIGLKTDNAKERTITFKFNEANPELAVSLREFAKIFKVTYSYSYDGISFTNGKLDLKGSAHVAVALDLENEDGTASDYITALGVMLAYNMDDAEERAEFTEALVQYANNIYAGNLKEKVEAVSIGELINAVQKVGEEKIIEGETEASRVSVVEILDELDLRKELYNTVRLEAKYEALLEVAYNLVNAVEAGIAYTENKAGVEISDRTLGGVRDLTESGYWCTYGGDFNYSDNLTIDVRLKMFAGSYESPVDDVLELLAQIPGDLSQIYHERCDQYGVNGHVCDNREAYLNILADARAAYDAMADEYKALVGQEYADRLIAAEELYNNMGVWVVDIEDYNYTGKAVKPEVRVYHGSTLLKAKTDYTVSYQYNTNAAEADSGAKAPRVIITLKKNYTGKLYAYFTIKPIDLAKAAVDEAYREEIGLVIDDVTKASTTKNSTANLAQPAVYLNGKKISTSEYTWYYPENPTKNKKETVAYKTTGTYPIVVTGKGKNFVAYEEEGKGYTVYQYVADKKMSSVAVKILNPETLKKDTSYEYTGSAIVPVLEVTYGNKKLALTEGVDYTVEFVNNINVGTATIILTGMAEKDNAGEGCEYSFYGTKKVTFQITSSKSIASKKVATVTMLPMAGLTTVTKLYTGSEIILEDGKDYKLTAADGTVLELGKDYTVSYKKNINAGTATVTFKGIGEYKGTVNKSFKIAKVTLTKDLMITNENIVVEFKTGGVKPAEEIVLQYENPETGEFMTLKSGKDYTLSWANTTKVATDTDGDGDYEYTVAANKQPKVTITGKGNFTGKFSFNYTITPGGFTVTANDKKLSASASNNYKTTVTVKDALNNKKLSGVSTAAYYVWDEALDTFVDVKESGRLDKKGRIKFLDGENEILMKVVATGKNNYAGATAEDTYRIYATSINSSNLKVTVNQKFTYNKYTQTIDMSALEADNLVVKLGKTELVCGEDYIITETSYKNNLLAGKASVTIQGIGNYGGTYTKKFTINKFAHSANSIAIGNEDGVELILDDVIANTDNLNSAIVVEYQKGGVKPEELIELKYTDPATGKTMDMVYGRDYKLTWSNTTKVAASTAKKAPTVKITGIGNFKGTVTVKYTIVNAKLSNATWEPKEVIDYSTKKNNYRQTITLKDVNGKKLANNTDYTFAYFKKVAVESADAAEQAYEWVKITSKMLDSNGRLKLAEGEMAELKVVITGKGNYEGEISFEYNFIRPAN